MSFVSGLVFGLILIQLTRLLSSKLRLVSVNQRDRWNAGKNMPRFAGPAILLSALVFMNISEAAVLSVFCLTGFLDDILGFKPCVKAVLLLIPCFAAAYYANSWLIGVLCWFFANSYNLLDHADGLAGIVAFVVLIFSGNSSGIALAGACAAFLFFNFPPARIYMGDSGSLMLGAAIVLLTHSTYGTVNLLWVNIIPVADTIYVVIRRLAAGRKPWIGGTDHTGHVLLRRGLHPVVVMLLYGVTTWIAVMVVQ